MEVKKLGIVGYIKWGVYRVVFKIIRPYVRALVIEWVKSWNSEAECEKEEASDCENCEYNENCPWESILSNQVQSPFIVIDESSSNPKDMN